jgi:ribosomal protein S18 acetylase RimI-like enzyme
VDFQPVEENLRQSFRLLASSREPGEVRETAGVTIASAGVTFQMFNAAFLSSPVAGERDLYNRIATAKVHFAARGLSWSYWVCEGWLDKAVRRRSHDAFRKHGLYLATELPGMLAERLKSPIRELPWLEMRLVADDVTWCAFCEIGALCFNVPLAWFREVFEDPRVWQSGFVGYVGYARGEAVATAATVIAGGAVGLYNVATLPGHRNLGYGESIMRQALDRARERYGIERTVLQSTPQGLRLYERMGYSAITNVAVYTS